jgi:hypothetical protein
MLSALRRLRPAQLPELATDACQFFFKVLDAVLEVPAGLPRHRSEVREVSHAEAGRLLRDAIASFWKYGAAPGTNRGERYGLLCSSLAIASARVAVLALGAAVTDAAAERWPAEARRALVEEFLASPQAAELRDPIARKCRTCWSCAASGTSAARRC